MWSSSFTMGYSKNEIKNSMQQPQINTLVGITGGNKNGYPVHGLFSIQFAGLNPENGVPMFYDENGTITSDINFQSTSTDYLKYEGPTDPKYTGGFNNYFTSSTRTRCCTLATIPMICGEVSCSTLLFTFPRPSAFKVAT